MRFLVIARHLVRRFADNLQAADDCRLVQPAGAELRLIEAGGEAESLKMNRRLGSG